MRPSLYDERVIGLGYTLMFLTHSNEALEIEKFKIARENKIEFAYDYGNLNESYVNEKINFLDDYFQEIINPDFEKIDSPFQQTSSLKPYVPTVILEKIIIDLEDEVCVLFRVLVPLSIPESAKRSLARVLRCIKNQEMKPCCAVFCANDVSSSQTLGEAKNWFKRKLNKGTTIECGMNCFETVFHGQFLYPMKEMLKRSAMPPFTARIELRSEKMGLNAAIITVSVVPFSRKAASPDLNDG
ncbi:hypothetical protein Tco_1214533 [Tanacetum coccineum]